MLFVLVLLFFFIVLILFLLFVLVLGLTVWMLFLLLFSPWFFPFVLFSYVCVVCLHFCSSTPILFVGYTTWLMES